MAAADAVMSVPTPHPKSTEALFARRNTSKPVMKFLEINLICAQALQPLKRRRTTMQTYAVVSVDRSTKLTSRLDSFGGQNPTWNDKFIFRVPADFLTRETSSVSVEIYAVGGFIKDHHVGSARLLLSTCIDGNCWSVGTPSFSAVQVQCPSSQFQGLLNVGLTVYDDSYFSAAASGSSAFCFSDLVGDSHHRSNMIKSWRSRSRSRSGPSASVKPCQLFHWTDTEPSSEERKSCRESLHQQIIKVVAPVLF